MRYKTCIFDFDFTLADANSGIVESVNYALNQAGLKPKSSDDIRKTVGMALKDFSHELTGMSDKQASDLFISNFMFMADKVMTDNTFLFNDSINVLLTLKQNGCNTAIVTNKPHYRIDEVLFKYGITELIDCIVGHDDVEVAKPSPEGLLKAIDHFGNDKCSVLYVGDSLIDANTAANASVDFAAVLTGTTRKEEFLMLPHIYIANNLTELIQYIC